MARGVKLLLSAGRTRALSGEGLPVEVLVRNGATTPIVLSVGPANPIVFELRATPDGPVAATRSSLMALREAIAGRSKRLPANTEEVVGPGDTVTFEENPAAGSSKPIPAGRYSLAARWEIDGTSVLSDAVELVVEPPSAGHLAALFCPFTGSQAQAFDHHGDGARLYQRETDSQRANASVFWSRAEVSTVGSLVLAVHIQPELSGRWLGWVSEGSLGALVGLGSGTSAEPPPTKVGLVDPVLVEPALQRTSASPSHDVFNWGEALFLVAGGRDGAGHVQAFVATDAAITSGPVAPLGATAPSRVLARWSIATQTIRLVWAETTPGGTRILARSYTRDLQPLTSEPSSLYERGSPLAALELEPIDDGRTPGFVHALFGPEGDNPDLRHLVYACIPLDDPAATPEKLLLPAPRASVDSYAISGSPTGGLIVLAKVGSEVWRTAARDPSRWQVHIQDVPELRHLRLATAHRYWAAMGADPVLGIVCVPDPTFRPEG
jgi:hypothetical protein